MNILDWVKNYKGHSSTAQNSIWHCLMMLSNFDAVKADIDGFDEKSVVKGEKDFYSFIKTLYQDMYENPEKYEIPTAAYDEYIKTINMEELADNEHKRDAKEAKLRTAFQQAIQFYPDYFYQLGLAADEICDKNYELVISKIKYNSVMKKLDSPYIKNENELRINALADRGITAKEKDKKIFISCKQSPKMFLGLKVLLSAPESKYKYLNYLRLDYKGYYRPMPEFEDVKMTLEKEHSDILSLLLSLFDNPEIKINLYPTKGITSNHKWKYEYFIKYRKIFEFYAGPAYLLIHIFFLDNESLMETVKSLEKNDPGLFKWLCDNFVEKHCNCPKNKAVMFGSIKKHICGRRTNRVEILNPNKNDVKKSVALIKILNKLYVT